MPLVIRHLPCFRLLAALAVSLGVALGLLAPRQQATAVASPPTDVNPAESPAEAPVTRPNVLLLLIDDLGWAELGCYGNSFNETPHIDRLAGKGMRFTQAYAAAPVSAASRAALMSGQSPARLGLTCDINPASDWRLPTELQSVAELFHQHDYATAIVGKWGLSGFHRGKVNSGPSEHGFQKNVINEQVDVADGSYFHPYTRIDPSVKPRLPGKSEYLIDRLNLEAVELVSAAADQPFFLLKGHYAVRDRPVGKPELVAAFKKKPTSGDGQTAKSNNPHLAAQLRAIDDGVGQIVEALTAAGRLENTLIIVTSTNGGDGRYTDNGSLRGCKSQLYEGGIRVPLLAHWPARIEADSVCTSPVITTDLHATFAELLTASPPPQTIDSVSLVPLLMGDSLEPRTLAWHFPLEKPHFLGGRSCDAIRSGEWKLMQFFDDGHQELYNLQDDPSEQNDVSAVKPKIAERLTDELAKWREQTTGNPNGDR